MKKVVFLFTILFSICAFAQEKTSDNKVFDSYRDSLRSICKKLYSSKNNSEKQKHNQTLLKTFELALTTNNSFDYTFDSLPDIKILLSPDKTFKLFNWSIENDDKTQEYFGFIQEKFIKINKTGLFKKTTSETIQLYQLIDKSKDIKKPENYVSDNKKWFGMWYYKIILKKSKSKTYYTLLGWDGNDKFSSKKIIDVLTFDYYGVPHFGADIFVMEKKYPKRVIFEYAATCTMSLKYNEHKDSIVFDHLAPTEPQLEGQYQYYCGDMSYDGFGFKNGNWNYGMDVNAVNEKDSKNKLYQDPRGIGSGRKESQLIVPARKKKKKK